MRRRSTWFVPTWNGDLRLESSKDDKDKTNLSIADPTPAEKEALEEILKALSERGWLKGVVVNDLATGVVLIDAPLEKVGPAVVAILRPGPAALTAIKLANGVVEVLEHLEPGKTEKVLEKDLEKLAAKPAVAAATVKRPTPSCPDCFVEAISPATQALLAFLTPEQHETWARSRYVVCRGGLSGHRYVIAHRSSEIAAKNGRICFDADDKDVLHFHDQSVPPEEEVLATMLCLQHREPWLRNEATCFYGLRFTRVFKNPFGDHMDGVPDAVLTKMVGLGAMVLGS